MNNIKREKWSREKIIEVAKNYSTKHEFLKKEPKAYDAAIRKGILSELTWLDGRGPLTYETVKKKAQRYTTLRDFEKCEGASYQKALKEDWIREFSWLKKARAARWSYEDVKLESLKYKTKEDFRQNSLPQYRAAIRYKWISEFTWLDEDNITYEYVKKISKNYSSLNKFKIKHRKLYRVAEKNGWIDDFTWLKRKNRHPAGYWSYYRVRDLALTRKTRTDLKKSSRSAYQKAISLGWIDEFDWLQDTRFDLYADKIDLVYSYEFTELNSVYVGRTLIVRQLDRDKEHKSEETDTVFSFAKTNNLQVPNMTILESDLLLSEGVIKEGEWVEKYKSAGWKILNKAKTGSIGSLSMGKWTYDTVRSEALRYKTFKDFHKNSRVAYVKAKDMGWIKEYTWLERNYNLPGYWTYEKVSQEAKKYHTRSEFKKKKSSAYEVARENKWLDEFFPKDNKA